MKVALNHTVRIDYELKVKDGAVIESSDKSGPLEYVHGQGKLLAALEHRLEGMAVGEEKSGELTPTEACGDESSLPVRELPRKEFPESEKLVPDRIFEAKTTGPEHESVRFKILAVEGELVKVRFLHPLADKTLVYRVKVLGIQPPRSRSMLMPPPPPAQAFGIESGAIVISAEDDDKS
jgi:FKBP-type peptidyl-prolyl cis-trans isomerase SlyD